MTVADLCGYAHRLRDLRDGDQIHPVRVKLAPIQFFIPTEDDHVLFRPDLQYVKRMLRGDAQTPPLTNRIADGPPVAAQHVPLAVHEIPCRILRAAEALHEACVVAVRHEANVLAVVLFGIHEAIGLRDPPHFFLRPRTKRKTRVFQLFLRHRIKYVTLVFRGVQALFQQHTAILRVGLDPGIVPGHNAVQPKLLHPLKKPPEFENAVAFDTGIRRPALLVGTDEGLDEFLPEQILIVEDMESHPQRLRHRPGIIRVLPGTAGLQEILSDHIIFKQAHSAADALVTRLFHEKRGHRRVHASAHGDQCLHP